jgi:hypothetical protein
MEFMLLLYDNTGGSQNAYAISTSSCDKRLSWCVNFVYLLLNSHRMLTLQNTYMKYDGSKRSSLDEEEFRGICEIINRILTHCSCPGDT